ncbi:MAG: hypothetical protein ABEJ25_03425 [Candidatus Bipolaricaulia bacterium]
MIINESVFTDPERSEGWEPGLGSSYDYEVSGVYGKNVNQEVPVVQLGVGTVGRELIKKVGRWNSSGTAGPKYSYAGFVDKSGFAQNQAGFSRKELETIVEKKSTGAGLEEIFSEKLKDVESLPSLMTNIDKGILVDVTDTGKFESLYRTALDKGWSVVLANKIPLTRIKPGEFRRLKNSGLRYETTVGAGLPVISTLDHLNRHGEEFKEIAAILSGSLSFILSRVEAGGQLSKAVLEAKEKGFTEPNPAEDLLGKDVARKTVILGRSLGLDLSLDDIKLEPLVPLEQQDPSAEELTANLKEANAAFREKVESAKGRDKRLRYLARITGEGVTVGLEEVDRDGPLAQGDSTANVVLFRTRNYDNPPLIVQGPGAGPEVTAGGVFSDIKQSRASFN